MTPALDGRIAIVTGAAAGLGSAMAERFLAASAPSERIPTADVTIEDWRRAIDVNHTGARLMASWTPTSWST